MNGISAAVILDAVLVLLLLVGLIAGASRGLIKTVWKMAAWILTIVLVIMLKTPFTSMLAQTQLANELYASITEKMTPVLSDNLSLGSISREQSDEIAKSLQLPEGVVSEVLGGNAAQAVEEGTSAAISTAIDNSARSVTMMILGFIAAVVLFILIKIALFIVYNILNAFSKLPIINGTNKLLGAVAGAVNVLLLIYTALAVISFIGSDNPSVYQMMNETYIVKYFYNYNIILQLFMMA